MKCIAYISRSIVASELSCICRTSRVSNVEHDISGILTYKNGYYLQVIEGDAYKVDRLYTNIQADTRHCDVVKLLDTSVQDRSFGGWNIKLIESVQDNSKFNSFINKHISAFKGLETDKSILLNNFYSLDLIIKAYFEQPKNTANSINFFSDKTLHMLKWPNFNHTDTSIPILELCAKLTSKTIAYNEIVKNIERSDKDIIDHALLQFKRSGLLEIKRNLSPTKAPLFKTLPHASFGFYQRVCSYLGVAHH